MPLNVMDAINTLKARYGDADEKSPSSEVDPRTVKKYLVKGTFYNQASSNKDDVFEELVDGENMSQEGANSAFYQKHGKKYPHYKINSIEEQEAGAQATNASEDDKAKKDGASPRHDGETARAGRVMNAEMVGKVADAALQIADRIGRRMDAEEKNTVYRVVMYPKNGVNEKAKTVSVKAKSTAEAFDKADKLDNMFEAIRLESK